jgi:hypothetical protein
MMTSERDWLVREQRHSASLGPAATRNAREALRAHIAAERPGRRRLVAAVVPVTAAAAVLVAVLVIGAPTSRVVSHGGAGSPTASLPAPTQAPARDPARAHARARGQSVLVRVADHVRAQAQPSGNATLVMRSTSYPGKPAITVADLYTDSGRYFFAQRRDALGAQVSAGHDLADGLFGREVAIASDAATGDVSADAERMASAAAPSHPIPRKITVTPAMRKAAEEKGGTATSTGLFDNWLWGNSQDALIAGAGNPQVRSGVLRLLATLSDVTVAQTTTDGQPTLTLTAGYPAMPEGYQEQLIIGADTGIPVKFLGGDPAKPAVTVTYDVTRVSTGALEAGH